MVATILVLLVAAIHFYIAYLEIAMWDTPRAHRVFGTTPELAAQTKMMGANQGLYNGFLAAGLVFGVLVSSVPMVLFLLICVGIAGVVGLLSGVRSAFIFQTIPATLALLAVWLS